ncbi:hypothetical protein EMO89_00295 [Bifidobacterium tissieri]|uniref:NrS-1 polymerase-like helicase domain-containing protein n=1 Tax=Bifidobacterium tissieri TaxID=1630162 RepID=A0A5M9ZXL0_9BIFI|nr:primase-helicase family protein [Bifidobacterium tissieri]KAA8832003.1 hypothetical protein EMO89_00295 [Bifidobacterium tissieri]
MKLLMGTRLFDGEEVEALTVDDVVDVTEGMDGQTNARLGIHFDKVRMLLKSIVLLRVGCHPDALGYVPDSEGNRWAVVVEHVKSFHKAWDRARAVDGAAGDKSKYNLPALIVAGLMSGIYSIYRDDEMTSLEEIRSIGTSCGRYHLYDEHTNEWGYSSMNLSMDELYAILSTMYEVRGVKHACDVLYMEQDDSAYEMEGNYIIRRSLQPNEVPLTVIPKVKSGTAERILAPLIGKRAFDALSMLFGYTNIAEPQGYIILADDGGTGKSTILKSFCKTFEGRSTSITLSNLCMRNDSFSNGVEYARLEGKSIAFADEVEDLDQAKVAGLNNISTGSEQPGRFGGGRVRPVQVQAWLFIATNEPDSLPCKDATERRRTIIRLNKSGDEAWANEISPDPSSSRTVPVWDYVRSHECIYDMVNHGMKLLMARQASGETSAYSSLKQDISMEDVPSANNIIEDGNEAAYALAKMLHSDANATAFMEGDDSQRKTRILVNDAKQVLSEMNDAMTFLADKLGIDTRRARIKDKDGKLKRVLYLTDRDKLRELWNLVEGDKDEAPVDAPQNLVPSGLNKSDAITTIVDKIGLNVARYLGKGYTMCGEEEPGQGRRVRAVIRHDGEVVGSLLVETLAMDDHKDEDVLDLTACFEYKPSCWVRLRDGWFGTLEDYAQHIKSQHGMTTVNCERIASSTSRTNGIGARKHGE